MVSRSNGFLKSQAERRPTLPRAAPGFRNADPKEIFKVISHSWERALGDWRKALQQKWQAISVKEEHEDQKSLHLALDI